MVICACKSDVEKSDYSNGKIIGKWNEVLTNTIIQDLFSPPVASRIYAYPNIAAYEVLKYAGSESKSITSRLSGFDSIPPPSEDINLTVAALHAFTVVGLKLIYTEKPLNTYYKSFIDSIQKGGVSAQIIERSENYGKIVADKILLRAASDMFKQTRSMERYTLKEIPGAWAPTPPDYMQGVEPNWNLIKPFLLDSCSEFCPDSILPYSSENNSVFVAAAGEVMEAKAGLDSDKVIIIKFWDDNPNVSKHFGHATIFEQKMTPGGHWMAIANNVVQHKEVSQTDAAYTFALTSIALFDAFIACWDAKYNFSTIRPVTFIQKHLDNEWLPYLQTPPFPEFPSGHSTISASAATVLTGMYGAYAFTDSSEVPYGLPVRSFDSFYEASDEAALSRLYGGIHFTWGNEAGKIVGRKVGHKVLDDLLAVHKIKADK